ncbi:MAG: hypothetical protein WBB82_07595 [Limnothrix sp.]
MKYYPSYFPYPISWLRATIQITAIGLSAYLIHGGFEAEIWTPVILLQPFGLVSFLLIPVIMSIAFHWLSQHLLHAMKGVRKPRFIESLWEGIYGWMVTIFALTLLLLFIIIPIISTIGLDDFSWSNDSSRYDISDPEAVLIYTGIYFVITAYLYQLEHHIRHFHTFRQKKTAPSQQTVAETQKPEPTVSQSKSNPSPQVPKTTIQQLKNEIEEELNRLKNQAKNRNNFGK